MVINRLSLLHGSMDPCNQAIKNQTKISFRHTMIFHVTTRLNADILTYIWLLAKHEDHQMQIFDSYFHLHIAAGIRLCDRQAGHALPSGHGGEVLLLFQSTCFRF